MIRMSLITKIIRILFYPLILFLSFFPRSVEVLTKNYNFGFDQGNDYLAAWDIAVNHKLTLIGNEIGSGVAGFRWIFQGPFYYYSLSIPFLFFGGDPYGGIVLMLFFGLLAILTGFILGNKIFGFWGGVIISLFIAICPIFISQSRFVWSPHPATFLIFLAFIFIYLMDKKPIYIFLAAFITGFIYNFELAIAFPMSITLLIYYFFVNRTKNLKNYLYLFSGFFLAYLPFILFEIRHGFMGLRSIFVYHPGNNLSFSVLQKYFMQHITVFYTDFIYTFPIRGNIFIELFLIIILIGLVFFAIKETNKNLKKLLLYICLLPFVTFGVYAFLIGPIWSHYLVHLNAAYIFLTTFVVYKIAIRKNFLIKAFIFTVFLIFIIVSINFSIKTTNKDYSDYGGTVKIRGIEDAIDYIYKDAKGNKFGLLIFAPPVYTYQYDYLILWYANKKYNYIPYKDKKGTFYLLIEQDPGKPWSYKGWLETVVKDGKIIWTKTLPSGFIIQKRINQ